MSLRDALRKPIIERTRTDSAFAALRTGATTLADVLAPGGVLRSATDRIQVGDTHQITLEVRSFPPGLKLGWLHDPLLQLDLPGVTIHQRFDVVPNGVARTLLTRSEDAARTTLYGDELAGTSTDVDAELSVQAVKALRSDLASGTDVMIRVAITITVSGATADDVTKRVQVLRERAAEQGIQLDIARFVQWEGYVASLPLGAMPEALEHDFSGRAAAMGMPIRPGGLDNVGGRPIIYGEHATSGVPVLWDRWTATNPHGAVFAESGSGKTYAMSGIIAQDLAYGDDAVLILDPKMHEYLQLVSALGGVYISLSATAGYHINPLELPRLSADRLHVVEQLGEDLLGQRIAFVKSLIVQELKAQDTVIDAQGAAAIERAVRSAYAGHAITEDPRTFARPNPTFSSVQECLLRDAGDRAELVRLADAMEVFTTNTAGTLFNHRSTIPLDNPLLAIDLSALLTVQDKSLERLLPLIVMDFFVTVALNKPTGRRYHLVLDEGHALLRTEAGARTMQTIFRIGRSLGFAATVITQSIEDLNDSSQTRVLIDNTPTKLVLGLNQRSNAADHVAALLHLNESEYEYVRTCRLDKGVGSSALLLADGQKTRLWIPMWSDTLHWAITGRTLAEEHPRTAAPGGLR